MCKYLRTVISKTDGETKFYCDARGTAYCKLDIMKYMEYAIADETTCKDYAKERLIKGNRDGVALSGGEPEYLDEAEGTK